MQNLGKAQVNVSLLSYLPNVVKTQVHANFDITAHSWKSLQTSARFSPLLIEQVSDDLESFAACYPAKRKAYINNYLVNGDGTNSADSSQPYILWNSINNTYGVANNIRNNKENPYDTYSPFYLPGTYPTTAGAYSGPKWKDVARNREPWPDDAATVNKWLQDLGLITTTTTLPPATTDETTPASTTTPSATPLPSLNYVAQTEVKDGLWWGVESSSFLYENMPFWVNIKRESSPSSTNHETYIIISLGLNSETDAYDFIISNNQKPRIIDYTMGRKAYDKPPKDGVPTSNEITFSEDFAKLLDTEKELEIGFMTIGGRLIIFFNKNVLIYTRTVKDKGKSTETKQKDGKVENKSNLRGDEKGTMAEAKIAPGAIRVYGTNIKVAINACAMTFTNAGIMAFNIEPPPPLPKELAGTQPIVAYRNVKYNGDIGDRTVSLLPNPPSSPIPLFGVDSRVFNQDNISDNPYGYAFHKQGAVFFKKASSIGITSTIDDYYIFIMEPDTVSLKISGKDWTMQRGGCPYFFRIKGGYKVISEPLEPTIIDVTEDVMSVNEDCQADEYYSATKKASISLYNKSGKYDYLRNRQVGVRIKWGWNGQYTQTFTGMTLSATSTEQAGKEVMDVRCEDYMFILKNTFIINSPFYDGMVGFYAVKDMLQRAGIVNVINEWDDTDEYFLPSGYAFTKPAAKFELSQTIFECIMYVVQREEAFVYFDENGDARVRKLPGGLLSVGAGDNNPVKFTRNPAGPNTILDEKNLEYNFDSTCNLIRVYSLEMDTRNAIIVAEDASALGIDPTIVLYKRVFLEDQAAFGCLEVAEARVRQLAQIIFYPYIQGSFKTAGDSDILRILDFVEVEGQEFRVLSIARKYNAENNDFTNEYNVEWLGGK